MPVRGWVSACAVWTLLACRSVNPVGSETEHKFGQTSRPAILPLVPCDPNEGTDLPKTKQYLTQLMHHIMSKNTSTFVGDLSPELFCISASRDSEFNAYAVASERRVHFMSPMLLKASTDAQVGSVLAHELAHITMRHGAGGSPDGPDQQGFAARSESLQKLWKQRESLALELKKVVDQHTNAHRERLLAYAASDAGKQALVEFDAAFEAAIDRLYPSSAPDGLEPIVASGASATDDGVEELADRLATRLNWSVSGLSMSPEAKSAYDRFVAKRDAIESAIASHGEAAANQAFAADQSNIKQLRERIFLIDQEINDLKAQMDAIVGVGMTPEQTANWSEQEADEVGYEMFLRSGLRASDFNWVERQQIGQTSLTEAMRACMAARDSEPKRGALSHPAACWRIWDIEIKEAGAHARDFAALKAAATASSIALGVTLQEAQAELSDSGAPSSMGQ